MDKASVYGTGDSRFEFWQGHFCDFVLAAVLSAVPNRGLEFGWYSYGAICIFKCGYVLGCDRKHDKKPKTR